jgi:hypothetical protein
LGSLVFAPVSNANGTDYASFTFSVQDSSGAFDGNPNAFSFNVAPVNDAPIVFVDGSTSYNLLDDIPVQPDGSITITDDNANLAGATVSVFNFQSGDVLSFVDQLGITGSFNSGTGVLTLSGSATLADYELALESVTFETSSTVLTTRTVIFAVNDGSLTSFADSASVTIVAEFNLSTLDGAGGFKIFGEAAGDQSGSSVSGAGDINGDGFSDLLVGAPQFVTPGASGASYVIFGKNGGFPTSLDLSTLDGTNGFQISGEQVGDQSGISVSAGGDVNGDGFSDVVIGARAADPFPYGTMAGASYVIFGKGSGFASSLGLAELIGSNGFQLSGEAAGDQSGLSVSDAGDVNGDGLGDVIIGAWLADPNGASSGASYVVFGNASGFASNLDLSTLDGTTGFQISGEAADDGSGHRVSAAGDVNGDGFDDFLIGAYRADPNGGGSGASYVVFGKASGFLSNVNLSTLTGANGFQISGEAAGDRFGINVSGAGDVNGDGFGDVIIGANGADPNGVASGASYVIFGKASGFAANVNLAALDGTNGFQISGEAFADSSGVSVSSAGDVNGDGFGDLVVGADYADPNGVASGASYVIFGKASGFAANLNLSALNSVNGFQISGEAAYDRSGISVSSAGDVNGDGFDDLIVGAWLADPHGADSGASYVVFGFDNAEQVDFLGTSGDDSLVGDAGANIVIGDVGNDTLDGMGGVDVLKGAGGDDVLVFDSTDRLVDGGSGVDTLQLAGSGESLDFSAIVDTRYSGIEVIDLTGTGDNSLTLETLDLLALSDSTNTLRVDGDTGDSVNSTGQGWVAGGQVDVGGTLYQSYADGAATLLLQLSIVGDSLIS